MESEARRGNGSSVISLYNCVSEKMATSHSLSEGFGRAIEDGEEERIFDMIL